MNARASTTPAPHEIRTFRAANTRAALAAIKAALGGDAVILETREVGGFFGRPEIEVTAAPPANPPKPEPAPAARKSPNVDDEVGKLKKELAEMRAANANGSRQAKANAAGVSPGRAVVHARLVRRGVEDAMAFAMVRDAEKRGVASVAELEEDLARMLRHRLVCADAPWTAPAAPKKAPGFIALVGPTGVGKTTTIAKIAARAVLEKQLKVALVTVDVYRVGASDQLARYGKIMGVPTYVARDEAALADAAGRCREMDLVLVDSAGRSDAESRDKQARLLRTLPQIELHLVLSAATGARELGAMARTYAGLRPERLIFSKLDEADGPGGLLSALDALPRPVTCVADGQRVPEDIRAANARELTRLVLGV